LPKTRNRTANRHLDNKHGQKWQGHHNSVNQLLWALKFDQVPRDIHTLDKFLEIFNHTQSIFEEHFNWNNSKELLKKYFIQKKIFQDNYIISFSNKDK
jgi:tRNA A37 N6-isopentenylltransferase MiaA